MSAREREIVVALDLAKTVVGALLDALEQLRADDVSEAGQEAIEDSLFRATRHAHRLVTAIPEGTP